VCACGGVVGGEEGAVEVEGGERGRGRGGWRGIALDKVDWGCFGWSMCQQGMGALCPGTWETDTEGFVLLRDGLCSFKLLEDLAM